MRQEQVERLARPRATRRDQAALEPLKVAPPRGDGADDIEELLRRIDVVLKAA